MLGRLLRGVFEGGFASRNPYAPLLAGSWALTAGPDGVAMGRFGWADPNTGLATNAYTEGQSLGIVLPVRGTWERVYFQNGAWYLRAGKGVILAAVGDFFVRFPNGAFPGQPVFADPLYGCAYTENPGDYQPTPWITATRANVGGLGSISTWLS